MRFPAIRPIVRQYTTQNPRGTPLERLISRLPKRLQPYTSRLRSAPYSHTVSFLILHEITAIVPLIGLAAAFHYGGWLPEGYTSPEFVGKFARYFGRKGWFGFSPSTALSTDSHSVQVERAVTPELEGASTGEELVERIEDEYQVGAASGRILIEVATAYAITKVLLPVRVAVSVWATPWFAKAIVGRIGVWIRKLKR